METIIKIKGVKMLDEAIAKLEEARRIIVDTTRDLRFFDGFIKIECDVDLTDEEAISGN